MLLGLFNEMRAAKVPVSVRELLDLINALKKHVVFADMDEFYYLARTVMVKDERHFDKFDRAFGAYFNGLQDLNELLEALIPEDWLRKEFERLLTDEEREQIKKYCDEMLERVRPVPQLSHLFSPMFSLTFSIVCCAPRKVDEAIEKTIESGATFPNVVSS
ncbi:MAG: hypothetical protein QNL70_01330, partial [Pseudomonas sp.]